MDTRSIDDRPARLRPFVIIGLPVIIVALVLLILGVVFLWPSPGVRFTVINHGPQRLRAVALIAPVSVHVLGDMEPGQHVRRKVRVGEGGVAIEYSDEKG